LDHENFLSWEKNVFPLICVSFNTENPVVRSKIFAMLSKPANKM